MPQIRDIKGEAPQTKRGIDLRRLLRALDNPPEADKLRRWGVIDFPNGQTKWDFLTNLYLIYRSVMNTHLNLQNCLQIKQIKHSSRFVCAHLGL